MFNGVPLICRAFSHKTTARFILKFDYLNYQQQQKTINYKRMFKVTKLYKISHINIQKQTQIYERQPKPTIDVFSMIRFDIKNITET